MNTAGWMAVLLMKIDKLVSNNIMILSTAKEFEEMLVYFWKIVVQGNQ